MTTFKDFVSVTFPAEKRPLEPMLGFLHGLVSLRFSWLFHKMPVSANAITGLQMVLMAIATYLIGSAYLLFGVILLHVEYILNYTDGEIARFRILGVSRFSAAPCSHLRRFRSKARGLSA